jgi:phage tail protein X
MKRLVQISDEEIRRADWINAVDAVSGQWETAWGLDGVAGDETPSTQPNKRNSILDVSLTRDDYVGLLNLIARVEQARGRLSPRVQALRHALQVTTADPASTRKTAHVYSDLDLLAVPD